MQQEFENKKLNNEVKIIYLVGSIQDPKQLKYYCKGAKYYHAAYKHIQLSRIILKKVLKIMFSTLN